MNGQQYKQQVFTVYSDTWVCNYTIRVAFSDPASVPAGMRIVDMNNKDITTITTSGTGDGTPVSSRSSIRFPRWRARAAVSSSLLPQMSMNTPYIM